jgi:pyridoxine 5-phosphate synthase
MRRNIFFRFDYFKSNHQYLFEHSKNINTLTFEDVTKLSVNINKFATLRNARGGNLPDVVKAAIDCQRFGADGITVHPRPDERHIRYADVYAIKPIITTEFNIEGKPNDKFIQLVCDVKPQQVTLVPDADNAITSNSGWDTIRHADFLQSVIAVFKKENIRVSIFLNPDIEMVKAAADTGTDRIEFYTGPYAEQFPINPQQAITPYVSAAIKAQELGLGINAGHDLNLDNLKYLKQHLVALDEVSIGHALICDAIYLGLENTIQLYKRQLL